MKYAFKTLFFCWLAAALLVFAAVKTGLPLDNILSEGETSAPKGAVLAMLLLLLAMFAFTAPFVMLMLHISFRAVFLLTELSGIGKAEMLEYRITVLEQQIGGLERQIEQRRQSHGDDRKAANLTKSLAEKKAALEKLRGTSS